MLTCGVVLQDGVLAERLVLPRDQNILEACRSGVITPKNHWSKQSRAALLLRHIDLDTHRDCKGHDKWWLHSHTPQRLFSACIKWHFMCRWRQQTEFCRVKTKRVRRFQPRSRFQSGKTRRTGATDKDTGNSLLWNYQPNIQKLEWSLLALPSWRAREYLEKNICCYNRFTNKA